MVTSKSWDWPGARWWRCDFHLHTPASHDARQGQEVSAEQWVEAARRAGLDAVAVTDHNTGEWIDRVQEAARAAGGPVVFPGVELTVDPRIHLLALFDPATDANVVKELLGRAGIPADTWGKPEAQAAISVEQALERIAAAQGLAIAAHVDGAKGLLSGLVSGQSLQRVLTHPLLAAVELGRSGSDPDNEAQRQEGLAYLDGSKQGYERPHGVLPQLTFSDAHTPAAIGRRSTWIKMTRPTLEGLRLALQDGALSVCPDETATVDPNQHAAWVIGWGQRRKCRAPGLPGSPERFQATARGADEW